MLRMNLLPTEQRKKVNSLMIYQNIVFSGLILILLSLVLILLLGGFLIFLNLRFQAIEKEIISEQSRIIQTETVRSMERKIKELNKELEEVKEAQIKESNIYSILDDISQNVLVGVEVYSLRIDRETKRVNVSGYSPTRENLLIIKDILEDSDNYKNIDFPLANLTNPRDIDFSLSFDYAD